MKAFGKDSPSDTKSLAALSFLPMETKLAANRIAERKLRDKQARRAQILSAARRIAELEGWSNVTVRRLSHEISYSQPVLYAHFGSREGVLAAVAVQGFQEIGLALEKARKRVKRGNMVESVAAAYLEFAASSPALYEAIGTVLGEPPWSRRANKNQAISAQPSERARARARRALHFPKIAITLTIAGSAAHQVVSRPEAIHLVV